MKNTGIKLLGAIFTVVVLTCVWCVNVLSSDSNASKANDVKYYEPGIDLPDGGGKVLVLKSCTGCHDLQGIPPFKGYWGRQQWAAMVEIMVEHGAKLNKDEAAQVTDYLNKHFGRQSNQ